MQEEGEPTGLESRGNNVLNMTCHFSEFLETPSGAAPGAGWQDEILTSAFGLGDLSSSALLVMKECLLSKFFPT